jgi:VanZ family protein
VAARLWLWGPVVAYMAFIFYESSQPSLPSVVGGISDKVLHILGYTVLGALLVRALSAGFRRPVTAFVAVLAVALTTAYGVSDEIHQSFVPPREMDPWDVVADAVGGVIAAVPLHIWFRPRRKTVR